jgi:hypothetical protein
VSSRGINATSNKEEAGATTEQATGGLNP